MIHFYHIPLLKFQILNMNLYLNNSYQDLIFLLKDIYHHYCYQFLDLFEEAQMLLAFV